jgi:hypothetical protein
MFFANNGKADLKKFSDSSDGILVVGANWLEPNLI